MDVVCSKKRQPMSAAFQSPAMPGMPVESSSNLLGAGTAKSAAVPVQDTPLTEEPGDKAVVERSFTGIVAKLNFSDEEYEKTPTLKNPVWSKHDTRALINVVAELSSTAPKRRSPPRNAKRSPDKMGAHPLIDWVQASKRGKFNKRHSAQSCEDRFASVFKCLSGTKKSEEVELVDSPSDPAHDAGEPATGSAEEVAKRQLSFLSPKPKESAIQPPPRPVEEDSDRLKKGDTVDVMSRTWPGMNKPGGAGRIWKVNLDGTYDVKYLLGGTERRVDPKYITAKNLVSVAVERHRRPRTIYDPDTMEAVVPADREKAEEEERERIRAEQAEKRLQRERDALEKQRLETLEAEKKNRAEEAKQQEEAKQRKEAEEKRRSKAKKKTAEKNLGKDGDVLGKRKSPEPSPRAATTSKAQKTESFREQQERKRKQRSDVGKKRESYRNDNRSARAVEKANMEAAKRRSRVEQVTAAGSKKSKPRSSAASQPVKPRNNVTNALGETSNPACKDHPLLQLPPASIIESIVADQKSVPRLDKVRWPSLPSYLHDSTADFQTDLACAAAIIAFRSAETPAPFRRPGAYPDGWEPVSESAKSKPCFKAMAEDTRTTVLKSLSTDNTADDDERERRQYNMCYRRLIMFRVVHDRLRLQFLEDVQRARRRYLTLGNGRSLPGASAFLAGTVAPEYKEVETKTTTKTMDLSSVLRRIEQSYNEAKNEVLMQQQGEMDALLGLYWFDRTLKNPATALKLDTLISDGWVREVMDGPQGPPAAQGGDFRIGEGGGDVAQPYGRRRFNIVFPYDLDANEVPVSFSQDAHQ
jgi:hypothetical protein